MVIVTVPEKMAAPMIPVMVTGSPFFEMVSGVVVIVPVLVEVPPPPRVIGLDDIGFVIRSINRNMDNDRRRTSINREPHSSVGGYIDAESRLGLGLGGCS